MTINLTDAQREAINGFTGTRTELIALASPVASPLHNLFDWELSLSAEEARLEVAREILTPQTQSEDGVVDTAPSGTEATDDSATSAVEGTETAQPDGDPEGVAEGAETSTSSTD